MNIAGARVYRYRLPLREPVVLGGHRHTDRSGLLLQLVAEDGAEGWGEAAPLAGFSRETFEEARAELLLAAQRLHGYRLPRDYDDLEGCSLVPTHGVQSVSFAVESAYYGLTAQVRGVWQGACINPEAASAIQVNGLLMGDPRAAVLKAARLAREGYRAVKLKVGARTLAEDVALVHAVRDALGGGVSLRLDANRAWSLDTAIQFAQRVLDCGIEYIEEPLRDAAALPDFFLRTGMPYALDESLQGWKDLHGPRGRTPSPWIERSAYSMAPNRVYRGAAAFVWKPTLMHVPNLRAAMHWGMFYPMAKVVLSATFESGVGLAALCNYAAAFSGAEVPAGLDTYAWLASDVLAGPLPLSGAVVDLHAVNRAAGLVNLDALEPVGQP